MSSAIHYNDSRIDALSQKILVALEDSPKPTTNGELATEFDVNRGKTHHRLTTHLIPAGLVQKTDAEDRPFKDGPFYTLTTSGTMWVQDERDEFARPKTLTDMSEEVREAQKKAEQASENIVSARKKRWEIKNELEEKIEDLKSRPAGGVSHKDMVDYHDMQAKLIRQDIDARASRLEARIDTLQENHEELESFLAEMDQRVQRNDADVDHLSEGIKQAQSAYVELKDEIDDLEEELEEIRVEQDSGGGGWWPR